MSPYDIWLEACGLGLKIEPGPEGKLRVQPASACPPDFQEKLIQHKQELLEWLKEQPTAQPPASSRPEQRGGSFKQWRHVALQIVCGEFDGCDAQMKRSLVIGLRGFIAHPEVRRALNLIEGRGE